jgi:peptidoglycan/LPS O-acetylase OafA/YrhL
MKQSAVYFPGLNGIRALAAILVIVCHIDEWSYRFGLPSTDYYKKLMGAYAVVMFFVLSGFLITFLLIKEKEKYGTISYRKFYTRRILRIWPVYYIVLFIGAFLVIYFQSQLSHSRNIYVTSFFYFLMVPNLVHNFGYRADVFGVLWSIGAEEQFYAFWPFIIKNSKVIIRAILIFLCLYLAMKFVLTTQIHSTIKFHKWLHLVSFDYMAVGAIAAWLYHKKHRVLNILYHPITQVVCWLFLIVSIFHEPIHIPILPSFDRNYHSIVYAILILNVGTNPKTLVSLENKLCNFLGKLSYGIYAYHFIVLFLVSLSLKNYLAYIENGILRRGLMFVSGIGGTVIISSLSYTYIESWFLKKKEKFMLIKSSTVQVSGSKMEVFNELPMENPNLLVPPDFTRERKIIDN